MTLSGEANTKMSGASNIPAEINPPIVLCAGPGPSDIDPSVLEIMTRAQNGHLHSNFVGIMDEIQDMLRDVFMTKNQVTLPMSGTGSFGMETCFSNLLIPGSGQDVIVVKNGVFGERMKSNVERMGCTAHMVEFEMGQPIDPEAVLNKLETIPNTSLVAWVDAETSSGVGNPTEELAEEIRKKRGDDVLLLVDAVTSLAGSELRVDDWDIDAVYSGGQKCMSMPTGQSPVTFSERAMKSVTNRNVPCQSWSQDMQLITQYWAGDDNTDKSAARVYHHTAPIQMNYAMHQGLRLILQEGLENRWTRHKEAGDQMRTALTHMGLDTFVKGDHALNQLIAVTVPDTCASAVDLQLHMLNKYGVEIGNGLGPLTGKIWRIGAMGVNAHPEKIYQIASAMDSSLRDRGEHPNPSAKIEDLEPEGFS